MDNYSPTERASMLKLAKDSIAYGLTNEKIMPVRLSDYSQALQEKRACFVTLKIRNNLRGCVGSLEAYQPLVNDIVHNAFASAFGDPRFQPLTDKEFPGIDIHISILSRPEAMSFSSEEDLLRQIKPGIDGLILQEHGYRGTFLPAVWEELPTPEMFLRHLKMKAGLSPDYWSDTIKVFRYTAISIA